MCRALLASDRQSKESVFAVSRICSIKEVLFPPTCLVPLPRIDHERVDPEIRLTFLFFFLPRVNRGVLT